jgi:hypothetical protein
MSDEEPDALQVRHLAYRAELKRQGVVVVNGPFDEQTGPVVPRDVDSPATPPPRPLGFRTVTHPSWRGRLASDVRSEGRRRSLAFLLTYRRVGDRRPMTDDRRAATRIEEMTGTGDPASDRLCCGRRRVCPRAWGDGAPAFALTRYERMSTDSLVPVRGAAVPRAERLTATTSLRMPDVGVDPLLYVRI